MKNNFSSYRNKLKRQKYLITQTIQAVDILQNYSTEEIIQVLKIINGPHGEHFLLAENGKKIFYHQLNINKIKSVLLDELLSDSKAPTEYLANIIEILCSSPVKKKIVNEIIQQCLDKKMILDYNFKFDMVINLTSRIKDQWVRLQISSSGIYIETCANRRFCSAFEDSEYFHFNRNRNKIINNVLHCVDQFNKGKPYVPN